MRSGIKQDENIPFKALKYSLKATQGNTYINISRSAR